MTSTILGLSQSREPQIKITSQPADQRSSTCRPRPPIGVLRGETPLKRRGHRGSFVVWRSHEPSRERPAPDVSATHPGRTPNIVHAYDQHHPITRPDQLTVGIV